MIRCAENMGEATKQESVKGRYLRVISTTSTTIIASFVALTSRLTKPVRDTMKLVLKSKCFPCLRCSRTRTGDRALELKEF